MSLCPDDDLDTNADIDDDEPIEALATIFARGILRLRRQPQKCLQIEPESSDSGLALCGSSRPDLVDGPANQRKEA
jgi:hypothetical protein